MVKFETITGKEINLDVKQNCTFKEIKEMLHDQYQWDIKKIHLLFDGSDQPDSTKLNTINLDGGKRFIVIYVEPTGEAPNIDNMIKMLKNFHPDPKVCLEALQKNNYDINLASEYLLSQIEDSQPQPPPQPSPQSSTSNSSNKSSSKSSNPSNGKVVQPDPNPFHYTPSGAGRRGLTDDEWKNVLKYKPPEMTEEVAIDIFIDTGKNIENFKLLFQ